MYTILENARIVISLLKKHNVRHIVLSPGGSNIPIIQGVQQDSFFKCYSVVDERSAVYFAIGLYQQTGEIIACCCTSAQATRNYIPGLTEAFYKHAPILAITMSKHPKYLGQDYMQCPIQTSLPIDSVKKSYSLPRIKDEHDRSLVVRTTNEAILELTHHNFGPVQLNIEELDSETWCFDEDIKDLPDIRMIKRYNYWDVIDTQDLSAKRILLLIGDHLLFTEDERFAIEHFCEVFNVYIYTNIVSNYWGKYAINGNLAIASMSQAYFEATYMPDIVITIGALTGDYGIYNHLFNSPERSFEHWRIDLDGNVVDTYGKLTRIYEMRVVDFFSRFKNLLVSKDHSYYKIWKDRVEGLIYDIDLPLSNLRAALALSKLLPANTSLTLAIHNSLRVWNYVQIEQKILGLSPVNAFGIDGATSMSIGMGVVSDELSILVTGDLAFLYDINALSIRERRNNFRILLCNNNGGFEFKGGNLNEYFEVGKYVAADNHFIDSKGWAETNGFNYIAVRSNEELDTALKIIVKPSLTPIIIEIFTTSQNEKIANDLLMKINKVSSKDEKVKTIIKSKVRNVVTSVIGKQGLKVIRKNLK